MSSVLALPPPLVVPTHRLRDAEAAARLEWFESDGRGGGAAGTVAGAATRREHGLLIIATDAPHVLLARLEERVLLDGDAGFQLGVNFYPDAVHPAGHLLLRSFALDPWPCWHYDLNGVTLAREVLVSRLARATIVRWRLTGADGTLELRPLIAARRSDALADPGRIQRASTFDGHALRHRMPDGLPPLILSVAAGAWSAGPDVYRATVHPRDADRPDGDREDLFTPGVLRLELPRGEWVAVACGTGPADASGVAELVAAELRRRESVAAAAPAGSGGWAHLPARLALAGDALVARRRGGPCILSGFPALEERPDRAIAALSGLCITTGRTAEAVALLRSFARRWLDGAAAPTPRLLAFVHAAADAVEAGAARGDLGALVRRAIDTCLARDWPSNEGDAIDELCHAALLRMRGFAPDHPSSIRYEAIAARWRERPPPPDESRFPAVPSATLPTLASPQRLARALEQCDRHERGALALPADRLVDWARALVRIEGTDRARGRFRELLADAGRIVEGRGLGHVPERLVDGDGAPVDAVACAALLSICAMAGS